MLYSKELLKLKYKNGKIARYFLHSFLLSFNHPFIHPSHISNVYSLFARSWASDTKSNTTQDLSKKKKKFTV